MQVEEEEKKAQPQDDKDKIYTLSHHIISKKEILDSQNIKFANDCETLKIAIIGNVDSGKSTLVGVLTKGLSDDGRGAARERVFNFPHEKETGRTSSIAHEIMCFNEAGEQVLPDRFNQNKNKYWGWITKYSKKTVTLLDLCGHEKYLKTTIFGLIGLYPDYAMIIVGANMGISRMTKEHLGIVLTLKIPFFVVLTKIDLCRENVEKQTMDQLIKILKSAQVNRIPYVVKNETNDEEIDKSIDAMKNFRLCPIFSVSNITNYEMKNPKQFQFDINEQFMVPGVGIVISGVIKSGGAKLNQVAALGPDKMNQFKQITIKTIHVNRQNVEEAYMGQFACFSIKPKQTGDKLTKDYFRKGMILIDPSAQPEPIWAFEASILVLHHSTTIKQGYQAVLHCGVVRQTASIFYIEKELLRTGDRSTVGFQFLYNAEYIKEGQTILLREGRTKILGKITKLLTDIKYQYNEKAMKQKMHQQLLEKKDVKEEQKVSTQKKSSDIKKDSSDIIQQKVVHHNENPKKQSFDKKHQQEKKQSSDKKQSFDAKKKSSKDYSKQQKK